MRLRSRPLAIALSLVPGWGHIYWGREMQGLALFTLFAFGAFSLLNLYVVTMRSGSTLLFILAAALTLGTLFGALIDIWGRTSPKRVRAEADLRERRLREGMVAYLRDDFVGAKSGFIACLKADPHDVEALFRLGVVCCRRGDARQARVWLRRARRLDLAGKWAWEVARELERLERRQPVVAAQPTISES